MVTNYKVVTYKNTDFDAWNAFIGQAKNASFLFNRNFMEYHANLFHDFSLIILDGKKWVAVLPANRVGAVLYSHQGLTYGGLIYNEKQKLASIIEIFKSVLLFLHQNKIEKLELKLLPSIYHLKPAEELNYALFLAKAQLIRRDSLAVLDMFTKNTMSKLRKRSIQKGNSTPFLIEEVSSFEAFWNEVLIPNLAEKHQAKPVHSLEEITKLKSLFPENIRQFNAYQNNTIVAGCTVFETTKVAHCQYISGKDETNDLGGLDVLFQHLIEKVFKNKPYFDFGISNESQGKILNTGLSYWKESFGASTIVHDFYQVETLNFSELEKVFK